MFDNTLTLVLDGDTTHEVSITDTDNGTTARRKALGGGSFLELHVSHTETKENKGVLSDRHLVRVDHIIPDAVDTSKEPVKVSAYVVVVYPRRADVTHAHVYRTVGALLNFLMGTTDAHTSTVNANLARLFTGES